MRTLSSYCGNYEISS